MIPKDLVLEGERVRLEPLTHAHLDDLRATCNDEALWEFTFQANPFISDESARRWIDEAVSDPSAVPFAIVDRTTNVSIGSTRYLDIDERHRKLEIGWTFIARSHWRTHVNSECKSLLFGYAFETWKAARVQLKAEAINKRSHQAILRIGATHEGTLRKFRIRPSDESSRDVAFYSVLDDEWPAVNERLQRVKRTPTST
ncbi:MAG: GNAT family N-acetyltransferase [Vulcanimicrobiaceae bacterium]